MNSKKIGSVSKKIDSIPVEDLIATFPDPIISIGLPQKELTKQELYEAKKENRFYLPVMNLNHADMWNPLPKSERKHLTDKAAFETCTKNCCNFPGVGAGCCRLDTDNLEHVLGPLDEKWITKIIKWFKKKGIDYKRHDIVIDYEEGKIIGENFFHGHPIFNEKNSYPILRMQVDGSHFCCKFLNPVTNMCGIYLQRGPMCKNYFCCYLKTHFLIKTPKNPNTFKVVKTRFINE